MVRDAELHSTEDQARKDAIEARNQADALIYSVDRTLAENKQKLAAADISRINAALEQARQAVKGDDAEAIRRTTAELQTASHAMAEALYKGEQKQASPADAGGVKDAEVVDAEFAETK
jgi:molecular chaperone DnaK